MLCFPPSFPAHCASHARHHDCNRYRFQVRREPSSVKSPVSPLPLQVDDAGVRTIVAAADCLRAAFFMDCSKLKRPAIASASLQVRSCLCGVIVGPHLTRPCCPESVRRV